MNVNLLGLLTVRSSLFSRPFRLLLWVAVLLLFFSPILLFLPSLVALPRAAARLHLVRSHLPAFGTAFPAYLAVNAMSSEAKHTESSSEATTPLPPIPQTDAEWKKKLTAAEYAVLRQKDTERAGNGGYTKEKAAGTYLCKACDAPLYPSGTKFDSGCGWPAFWSGLPGAIKEFPDADGRRVEIVCARCGSHLGHVFRGESFGNPVDERHCVNSICLKLKKVK